MNENLAEVIRRYEQERSRRIGAGINDPGLGLTRTSNGDEPVPSPRGAGCGGGFAPQRVPRRAAAQGPAGMTSLMNPSLPFGAIDKDWTAALSRLNSVGLASPGCLACEMTGGLA